MHDRICVKCGELFQLACLRTNLGPIGDEPVVSD